jgi:predicted nucleic acid-binding OB-fold protein
MSEMKTSVNHIKNIIEIISNRLDQAKERLSEIEDEVKKYYIWTALKEKQI